MAGIPVNNNLKALTNIVNQTANAPGTQNAPYADASYAKQEEALQDTFNMVMNRISNQVDSSTNAQEKPQTVAKTSVAAAVKTMSAGVAADYSGVKTVKSSAAASDTKQPVENADDASKQTGEKTADTVENTKTVENEISEGQEETVKEAGEKLVEEVAKEMDVTPEEVEEVMEILGLSAIQLLDPENMKQLLIALSGNEDQLSIVTDAELYGHLQNLLDTVAESLDTLKTQLQLTEEELNTLIADMTVVKMQPENADDADVIEDLAVQPETDEDVPLEGMKDYAVTVRKDGEEVQVKVTVNDADGSRNVQEEVTAAKEAQPKHESKSGNRNASGENRGEGNTAGNFVMPNTTLQPVPSENVIQQPIMERFVSTQDIMDQIMEYMKINLRGDVQELELQLHPASLGNVNVQIAAKDGAITAQFTAQNDVVKAAIESQLIQLKTQFEEQGIKVDAVEVTVADYRFEQNFSGNEENAGEGQENGKKNRRRINLNELDLEELPEDMDDSERLTAEMMAASGSTIDYTA